MAQCKSGRAVEQDRPRCATQTEAEGTGDTAAPVALAHIRQATTRLLVTPITSATPSATRCALSTTSADGTVPSSVT